MCGIGLLAALFLAISRRIAFSVYAALAIAVVLALPSMVKARMTGMSLHSFDLALIADPQMLGFFLSAFGQYAVPVLAIAVVMIGALMLVCRHEQPIRVRLWQIAVAGVALAVTAPLAMPRWADETSYLFQGRHISALLVSLRDLPQLWAEHPLSARVLRAAATPPYDNAFVCDGDFASTAYDIYYAANVYGADTRLTFPDYPLDAPYIGYWLIEASGIASGGIVEDMRQLRERCAGKLHLCQEVNAVDEVLRRRVDSGLLMLRPLAGGGSS